MQVIDFTMEYQKNPIGMDRIPRFSWKMKSDRPGTMQQGYQILVKDGRRTVWDSGRRESGQSLFIVYHGEALKPHTRYQTKVTVWDNHGENASAEGTFDLQGWQDCN